MRSDFRNVAAFLLLRYGSYGSLPVQRVVGKVRKSPPRYMKAAAVTLGVDVVGYFALKSMGISHPFWTPFLIYWPLFI